MPGLQAQRLRASADSTFVGQSGYAEIIAPVWKSAVEELKSATRICIVGYSIPETDAFFKYLITMALAGNHPLYNLIVVDYRVPIFNHPLSLEVQGYSKDLVRPRYLRLLDKVFKERRFLYFDKGWCADQITKSVRSGSISVCCRRRFVSHQPKTWNS
jgi:hypothetical protein